MSFLPKDLWSEWAQSWGLTHRRQTGWLERNESVAGERKGFLIQVGWAAEQKGTVVAFIRFPRATDVERIRQALIDDASLDTLPSKGAARRKTKIEANPKKTIYIGAVPEFTLTDSSLKWRRTFAWRLPKAAQLEGWVDALVAAVARVSPPFDGRCESCGGAGVRSHVLVDGLPTYLCGTCQQRLRSEGDMAERTYDMIEVNYVNGAALAMAGAVVGAVAWAALGALTHRIFAAAAIGIGALVAFAYRRGAGRVDLGGRVIAAFLTLASVVMGEVALFAWWVGMSNPEVGVRIEAGWFVYARTWAERPGDEIITLIFGLVGAWVASKALSRPKLGAKIESADPGGQQRAA